MLSLEIREEASPGRGSELTMGGGTQGLSNASMEPPDSLK